MRANKRRLESGMNKEQYSQLRKVVSEKAVTKIRQAVEKVAVADGCKQGIALVLYSLAADNGFTSEQLNKVTDNIQSLVTMPGVMGKSIHGHDVIDHLKKAYSVDVDRITIRSEVEA